MDASLSISCSSTARACRKLTTIVAVFCGDQREAPHYTYRRGDAAVERWIRRSASLAAECVNEIDQAAQIAHHLSGGTDEDIIGPNQQR